MSGFQASGVPYYANPNTLPIRPRLLPELSGVVKTWKADKARAYRYVHEFLNKNWKEGDRFVLTEPSDGYNLYDLLDHQKLKRYIGKEWITWTGTFIKKKDCGASYFIYVKLDGDKKPKIGSRFGMFTFYHLAEKIENEN